MRTRAGGFSLIELLVVTAIVAVLAGLVMPATSMVRASSRRAACASNQRNLVAAMLMFQDDQGSWPVFYANPGPHQGYLRPAGRPVAPVSIPSSSRRGLSCDDSAWTAAASLELLAAWSAGDISRQSVSCPASQRVPEAEANPGLLCDPLALPNWYDMARMSFAYDYGVPANARSSRVVLADRPTERARTAHGLDIVAACADGHIEMIHASGQDGAGGRYSTWNQEFDWIRIEGLNPNEPGDNIYDPIGDLMYPDGAAPPIFTPVRGSATRAWVR